MIGMPNRRGNRRRLMPKVRFEDGQAIVLIAFMMILLLGMAAVAIDGGGLFFLKRDAQNAVDAATLVAVRDMCLEEPFETVVKPHAKAAAAQNGFTEGQSYGAKYVDEVKVDHPTAGELPVGADDPNNYARVTITATKPSYFAQVVYRGPLRVTVQALGHCVPEQPATQTYALFGLRNCDDSYTCGGGNAEDVIDFSGSQVTIEGGINSNCDCKFRGNESSPGNGPGTGTGPSTVTGGATCAGSSAVSTGTSYLPDPPGIQTDQPEISGDPLAHIYPLSFFQLGSSTNYASAAADDTCPADTVDPDTDCYHVINSTNPSVGWLPNPNVSGEVFEGLYYIEGDFSPNGNMTVGPKGATFVSPDGELNFTKLPAPGIKPYEKAGFLMAASYKDDICNPVITGPNGNDNIMQGVIYAPRGECSWTMADNEVTYGAIMCQKVNISGSNFTLVYDPSYIPRVPAYTEVAH